MKDKAHHGDSNYIYSKKAKRYVKKDGAAGKRILATKKAAAKRKVTPVKRAKDYRAAKKRYKKKYKDLDKNRKDLVKRLTLCGLEMYNAKEALKECEKRRKPINI